MTAWSSWFWKPHGEGRFLTTLNGTRGLLQELDVAELLSDSSRTVIKQPVVEEDTPETHRGSISLQKRNYTETRS